MIYKRGRVWWIRIKRDGREFRATTGTSSKTIAKDREAELRRKLSRGEYDKEQAERTITFREVWERYMAEDASYKAPGTYSRAEQCAKNFLPMIGDLTLAEVKPAVLSSYKAARLKKGKSMATVGKELQFIRRVFSLCKRDWQLIRQSPFEFFRIPAANNQRVRYLEEAEFEKLCSKCSPWLRQIVLLARHTGIRRGNILGLTWSQVDLDRRVINLDRTKNGQRLTVPLGSVAFEVLDEIRKGKVVYMQCPYVFHQGGKPYSPWRLSMAFKRACKRAGITNFRFHDLRHDFASNLVQKGNDVYVVQQLLGHKDGRMTQRYAHLRLENLRRAVETLERGHKKGHNEPNEKGLLVATP
jgi:integrase